MDGPAVEKALDALDELLDPDNPPLLALIVLANGAGLTFRFPYLRHVEGNGSPEQQEAALRLVRAQVRSYLAKLEAER